MTSPFTDMEIVPMYTNKLTRPATALLAALLLAASLPVWAQQRPPSVAGYTLGPGDVLDVRFWGFEDLSAQAVVRPDGFISLPLINEVEALGSTPGELAERVAALASAYVEEPAVTVIVREIHSRQVYITGEVATPGRYELGGATTVLQLIALAGGLTEFADTDGIVVIRPTANGAESFRFDYRKVARLEDLSGNIMLLSGDTVVVP